MEGNFQRGVYLFDVPFDIHCEARCLRDGQAEVQRDHGRKTSKAQENAPCAVNVLVQVVRDFTIHEIGFNVCAKVFLEPDRNEHGDNTADCKVDIRISITSSN